MSDKERRKMILWIYFSLLLAGILYYIFMQVTGLSLQCSYKQITGYDCGGCGTTRMFQSLIALDFKTAIAYNPVVFVLLILWHIVGVLSFIGKPKFINTYAFFLSITVITILTIIIYGFLRNIC